MSDGTPAATTRATSVRRFRRSLSLVLTAVALAVVAPACEIEGNGTGTGGQEPVNAVLIGLADFHNHQFAHLGFGGYAITHSPHAADDCIGVPPFPSDGNRVEAIVRKQMFETAAIQAAAGKCYPTYTSWAGQRVDTSNLEHAWRYGLRLIVMLAISNEYLCYVGGLGENPALDDPINNCPRDRKAIEAQLQAAKDLEARIDADSGGPGMGWYRIVRSPEEARHAIEAGKLAVVLGLEAVNAFGCRIVARDVVAGVPNLGGEKPEEQAYQNACDISPGGSAAVRQNHRTQLALALFDHYWRLGARHFFPIHNMDGTAGGTAAYIPVLHSEQNPTRVAPGDIVDRVRETERVITAIRPPFETTTCPGVEFDQAAASAPGRCNVRGLTETGRQLIRMMASYGAVIDVDHLSRKAKNEVLGKEGLLGGAYAFVSSHSGPLAISHGDASNEGRVSEEDFAAMIPQGGAFAPVLPPASVRGQLDTYPSDAAVAKHDCGGTSESFVQAYRYVVDKLRSTTLLNGKPAFVGVGVGTDFTAPGTGGPAPRFDNGGRPAEGGSFGFATGPTVVSGSSVIGIPGLCYLPSDPAAPARVQYPFKSSSPDLGRSTMDFDKTNVPWTGARNEPYDISVDGVVHIGMIPDFVEELRTLGLTDADLEPLWHGAEAYIRAWEASVSWKGNFNTEDNKGIEADCSSARDQLINGVLASERIAAVESLLAKGCHGTPSQ